MAEQFRPGKRVYCGHCSDHVSKTLFYKHKRDYYNTSLGRWAQSKIPFVPSNDVDTNSFYSPMPPPSSMISCYKYTDVHSYIYDANFTYFLILHIADDDDTDIDSSPPSDDNIQSYLENYSSNDSNIVT